MKRLVDFLIVVLAGVILGGGIYFGYTVYIAEEDESSTQSGAAARVSGETVELPRLSTAQLNAVLPSAADLPPDLSGATGGDPTRVDLNTSQDVLSLSTFSAATSRFTQIRSTYSWVQATSATFNTCALNRDTAFVRAAVSQFPSSQQARAFIDDAFVRGYYRALQFQVTQANDLHGFYLSASAPVEGDCYTAERQHLMFFEHLGLVTVLHVNTNASASPALGRSTLDAVAARVVSNIAALDALTDMTLPPTPTPSGAVNLLTASTRPDDLSFLMPSTRDWDLVNIYSTVDEENQRLSLTELVDFYRAFNTPALNQLADTIDRAGRRYGLIAESIRVWTPDTACPPNEPVRIEVDLMLFERPAGAEIFMRDADVQAAWQGTGVFSEFQTSADGVYAFGTLNHACGAMQVVQKSASYERLLYTLSMTLPTTIDRQSAIEQIDAMLASSLSTLYLQRLR